MDKIIRAYIKNIENKEKKKSFFVDDLEDYIVKKSGGYSSYQNRGGYFLLHKSIKLLESLNEIRELKTVGYNGKNPPLKARYSIIPKEPAELWPKGETLRLSDLLDMSYYIKNPTLQTAKIHQYIDNIYNFLKTKDSRPWLSCEERCLELFKDEKFLDNKDAQILKRLNVSYDDLKMKKYGHMFVYWNRGTPNIENIIILENHSTFFSYKRAAMEGRSIFGFKPDALIYGEGKKIIKSFLFLEEIADIEKAKVLYFGDIDPEGFMIYRLLKEKYKNVDISLQLGAYKALLQFADRKHFFEGQTENEGNVNYVLDELYSNNYEAQGYKIKDLFVNKYRIPQEYINYEYLSNL